MSDRKYKKYDTSQPVYAMLVDSFGEIKTVRTAAKELNVTPATIYRWIDNGGINSNITREVIRARGYDPDTFKRI